MKLADIVLLTLAQTCLGLELQHIRRDWLDDVFTALAGPVSSSTSSLTKEDSNTEEGSFWKSFDSVAAQDSKAATTTSEYPSFLLAYATLTQADSSTAESSTSAEGFFDWLIGSDSPSTTSAPVEASSTSSGNDDDDDDDDSISSDYPEWLLSDLNGPKTKSKTESSSKSKTTKTPSSTSSDSDPEESLLNLVKSSVPTDLRSILDGDTFSSGFPSALLAYGATKSASGLLDSPTSEQALSTPTEATTLTSLSSSSSTQSSSSSETSTDNATKLYTSSAGVLIILVLSWF